MPSTIPHPFSRCCLHYILRPSNCFGDDSTFDFFAFACCLLVARHILNPPLSSHGILLFRFPACLVYLAQHFNVVRLSEE